MDFKTTKNRHHYRHSVSIDSSSSYSDQDDESPFEERGGRSLEKRLQAELASIFSSNRFVSTAEHSSRPQNVYYNQQERTKHHSGGTNPGKKMTAAFKRFTDKLGKQQQQKEERYIKPNAGRLFMDPWRRYSLDSPVRRSNAVMNRQASVRDDYRRIRPAARHRSNSEVQRFKIVTKNGDSADFTVTEPSRFADASALCQEYFSRVTCYDAVPFFPYVIAVDTRTPVSKAFDVFCDNAVTAVVLWDSIKNTALGVCRIDDLVCSLRNSAKKCKSGPLFNMDGDFHKPLKDICTDPLAWCTPADTSLIDAARFICEMSTKNHCRGGRLILINESSGDIVHLMSAWDILHFFSQQMSKYQAAHAAFDRTLGSILSNQSSEYRQIEILDEKKPLKEVIELLASKDGSVGVSSYDDEGTKRITAISFMDIIQYVIKVHGSWDETDAAKLTVGHVTRYHSAKPPLAYTEDAPLFAIFKDWVPPMSADSVVLVLDTAGSTVLGILEPEHLLQTLLSEDASSWGSTAEVGMRL